MKITTIINGSEQVILQPENDLEKEIIKRLDGAECSLVGENVNVLGNNIGGSLVVRKELRSDGT